MKIKLLLLFLALAPAIAAQKIENLGNKINSAFSEIAPCPSAMGLFFVRSNHPANTFGSNGSQDIWFSKNLDTAWAEPLHLPMNHARYNAVYSVLSDSSLLIRGVFNKKGNFYKKRGLSICTKIGNSWGPPKSIGLKMLENQSEGAFGGGAMNADGTLLAVAFSKKFNGEKNDIYIFSKNRNGSWGLTNRLPTVNTIHNESAPSLSAGGTALYFSSDRSGHESLYKSNLIGKDWSKPKEVVIENPDTKAGVSSFRVDSAEEWIYFSSNSPSGFGKADIFRVRMPGKRNYIWVKGFVRNARTKALMSGEKFTILVNGKPFPNSQVNTDSASYRLKLPKDTSVMISASLEHYSGVNGKLNARNDVRKFDLELIPAQYALVTGKVRMKGTRGIIPGKAIRAILNDGKPIDSARIDTVGSTYTVKLALNKKYRLSALVSGYKSEEAEVNLALVQGFVKQETDLYVEKQNLLVITGRLLDKNTNSPIDASKNPGVTVEKAKNIPVSYDAATGRYEITVEQGEYLLTGKADKYFPGSEKIEGKTILTAKQDILLSPAEEGKAIQLNNILFVRGKAVLLPSSDAELANLLSFMQQNQKVKILIGGHTDNQGSYKLNKKLSENRAAAVYNVLVANGILKSRLKFEGFGPSKPVAANNSEKGRRLNRRVEVTMLKM